MAERLQEIVRLAVGHVGDLDEWSRGRTPQGMQQIWDEADTPASMLAVLTLAGQDEDAALAMLVTLEYVATRYEPKAAIQAIALQAIITEEVANGQATIEEVVQRFASFVESVKAHRFLTETSRSDSEDRIIELTGGCDYRVPEERAKRMVADQVGAHLCGIIREVVPDAPKLDAFVKGVKKLKASQRGMRVIDGNTEPEPAIEAANCTHAPETVCACRCHVEPMIHDRACCAMTCDRCGVHLLSEPAS